MEDIPMQQLLHLPTVPVESVLTAYVYRFAMTLQAMVEEAWGRPG
jgi:hypothetical protein